MSATKLEREFEELCDSIGDEIHDHVLTAQRALRSAVALSDKHGIPFYTNVSEIGQPYIPSAFRKKYGSLNKDFVCNLTEVLEADLNEIGWQTSTIC
jgi:hypothetical protein